MFDNIFSSVYEKSSAINRVVGNLRNGDHLSCLYENDRSRIKILTAFFETGIRNHRKIVYIADHPSLAEAKGILSCNEFPVEELTKTGQLVLLSPEQTYLKNGCLDPAGSIDFMARATRESLQQGYQGLNVGGDMFQALAGIDGAKRLIEYEARLNRFFPDNSIIGICFYDINRFQPDLITKVLENHPLIIIEDQLVKNFFYLPPGKHPGDHRGDIRLRTLLNNLLDFHYTYSALLDIQNELELAVKMRTRELDKNIRKLKKEIGLRRQSEAAMVDSEEKLAALVNAISESTLLIDRETNILEINETGARRLGFSRAELLGKPFDFCLSPSLAPSRKKMVRKVISSKKPVHFIDQCQDFFYETSIWPVFNKRHDVDRLAIFARDITEQKKLKREVHLINAALDSAISGIVISDQNYIITYVNEALINMWGFDGQNDLIGKNGFDFWPDKKEAERAKRLINDRGFWLGELETQKRGGGPLYVLVSASGIYDDAQGQIGYMASFVDISAQKKAEKTVYANNKQLEEYNTALKVLIEQRDMEKKRLKENVLTGINTLIRPFLERIREDELSFRQMALLESLDLNLNELAAPMVMRLSSRYSGITPRENEIALMIKNGKTSDEIAEILNVSRNTVIFHRQNLRRKLGLQGKKKSLAVHLQEIMASVEE